MRTWSAVLLLAVAASLSLGYRAERRMAQRPSDELLLGQSSGEEPEGGPRAFQSLRSTPAGRLARYGFQNFNRDRLEVFFQLSEKELRAYEESFGYATADLDAIDVWAETARQAAYRQAVKRGQGQAAVDAAAAAIDRERDARVKAHLAQRGFRVMPGGVVAVDMPALVRRNAAFVKPLALSFDTIASRRRYRSSDIIGAALSFVQTAMRYQQPDPVHQGKRTGGVLPPVTALMLGWGDCDTKTGLLGSLLSNWAQMRMVGVSAPGHYLMGVLLIPEKGDLYLEHQGLQYVLVEPAGPAWLPPGQVSERTAELLNGREGYRIEPFFQGGS